MPLLEAAFVLVVGLLVGALTRAVATVAAVVALVIAVVGFAAPPVVFDVIDPVLAIYTGNELLFLSGFLFAIGHRESGD